jgi:penicillin-insensitive murein endopeptidase
MQYRSWLFGLGVLAVMAASAAATARPTDWGSVRTPTSGPPRVIGGHAAACLAGAVALPLEGPGYQAMDLVRRRYFGHPDLVAFIGELGRRAHTSRLGTVLVGDMAQPRGGPMSYGHVSHQSGLDVDIWFRLDVAPLPREARDGLEEIAFVDPATGRVDPTRWTDAHAELVRLAATHPRVSRIFVDAAIKRDLCERRWDDRSWLRLVRPWPFHEDHMHVRLRCPEGATECREQTPLPPGEACEGVANPPATRVRRSPRGHVPVRCLELLESVVGS